MRHLALSRVLSFVSIVCSILLLNSWPAAANHFATSRSVVGGFGIDGDFVYPSNPPLAGENKDWQNVGGVTRINDLSNDSNDDSYGGGSKEEDSGTWTYVNSKSPGKDDFTRVYLAQEVSQTKALLWLGFERLAIQGQGDAHANFELNRKGTTIDNGHGLLVPERSDNDLLIVYDYSGGSNPVNLEIRTWKGGPDNPATPQNENALSGTWTLKYCLPTTTKCPAPTPPGGSAWADINGTTVTRPDLPGSYPADPFEGGSVAPKRFGEVGLDLVALFGQGFVGCPGFSQTTAKTRSSGESFSSNLEDKVGPFKADFSGCAHKTWQFSFSPQPIAGSSVYAVYTVAGGEQRSVQLTDPDGDGIYTATDNEIPAGTVTYHFEVRNGSDLIWRSDADPNTDGDQDGTETFTLFQQKTNTGSLAYDLTLTPESGTNFTGEPHDLTAHVFEVGTNKPLPNVTVNFETFDGTPAGCGNLTPASDVTDANGDAQTTLTSADPCTTSIRAFVDGTTATGTTAHFDNGEVNDTAGKTFETFAVTVTPGDKVNEANQPHEFTIYLTKDTGGGPVGLDGATVHLSLDTGGTDAQFTEINGSPASGTEADCVTQDGGYCKATINATTTGEVTLTATYTTTAGGVSRSFDNTATKHYVDASIAINSSGVNEVGHPHTFTITANAYPDGTGTPTFDSITTSVDPAPDSQESTCDSPTISEDGNTATCTLTITNATAQHFTADATVQVTMGGLAVTRSTSGTSGPGGTGSATKDFVDASISICCNGVNEVGKSHTFDITVHAYPSGAETTGYAITTDVTPTPDSQSSTCDDPTITDGGNTATCTLTISNDTVQTFTANASADVTMGGVTVTRSTSGNAGPGGSGPATKTFFTATITKVSCSSGAAPGGLIRYAISFNVDGATLHNAIVADDIPNGEFFVDASDISGTSPTTPVPNTQDGTVTWSFDELAPGTYSGTIDVRIADDATGTLRNTVSLDADELTAPKTSSSDIVVGAEGKSAGGRAYGIRADILGGGLILGDPDIAPTPDSDVTNPGELASVDNPLVTGGKLVTLLKVEESDQSSPTTAAYTAKTTAAAVDLNLPVIRVEADAVVAKSFSEATANSATSSSAGSTVLNLRINGKEYGDISEPTTIKVKLGGATLGEVHILEKIPSGAAAGDTQPNGDALFASGLEVNAIHVLLNDIVGTPINEHTDIIVSHADTSVAFPSGIECATIPTVSGDAYTVGLNGLGDLAPDLVDARVTEVKLPITGGDEAATLSALDMSDLAPVASARTAFTHTYGEITDGPDAGDVAVEAHSLAQIEELRLNGGAPAGISADLIKATSNSNLDGSDGNATIAGLFIGATDVCATLGLDSTCTPDQDTVLVLDDDHVIVKLNEHISEAGGLTVNAVHIWIVGDGDPFGLGFGAEIVISSAHSDAHPAPAVT
jgi:hypothetical protein